MSAWMDLDGHVVTTATPDEALRILIADVPSGSEGPARVYALGPQFPGYWSITGNLRDMDEDDVPAVRDWFVGVVDALGETVTEAELALNGYRYTYVFRFVDSHVRLQIPALYAAELAISQ